MAGTKASGLRSRSSQRISANISGVISFSGNIKKEEKCFCCWSSLEKYFDTKLHLSWEEVMMWRYRSCSRWKRPWASVPRSPCPDGLEPELRTEWRSRGSLLDRGRQNWTKQNTHRAKAYAVFPLQGQLCSTRLTFVVWDRIRGFYGGKCVILTWFQKLNYY